MTAETDLSILADIVERMPGGFFIYRADDSQELLYANDVMLEIFGCEDVEEFKELTGYTFKGLVHPDDFDAVQASISKQVTENEKEMDSVEYRIIRKDGSIRWIDDFGRFAHTPIYGDIYYVFIRDITDIHMAHEENLKLEKVIKGLSVGFSSVYLVNLDAVTIQPYFLKNDNFQKITAELDLNDKENFNWDKVFALYAEKFVLPEDKEFYLQEINVEKILEKLEKFNSVTIDYRCKGENDKVTDTEMFIARVEEESKDCYVVVGFRDVTDHNKRT